MTQFTYDVPRATVAFHEAGVIEGIGLVVVREAIHQSAISRAEVLVLRRECLVAATSSQGVRVWQGQTS